MEKLVRKKSNTPARISNPYLATCVKWEREGRFSPVRAMRTYWEQAGNSVSGAPSAARRRRLIMGVEFTQQNPQQRQWLVGRRRMWVHDSQGLGKLLPPKPAHKETVYVFCLPKSLCELLKPVCPEVLTINIRQPVLQVTSPFVNDQGVTDEAQCSENS